MLAGMLAGARRLGATENSKDKRETKKRRNESPESSIDVSDAPSTSNANEIGKIYVTIEWGSRTRGRLNEGDGERVTCAEVPLRVSTKLRGATLVDRCVELPPGSGHESWMLTWGSTTLNHGQLHGQEGGGWALDVTEGDARLTLRVPNGTLLRHPALARETGGKRSVPKALMCGPRALIDCEYEATDSATETTRDDSNAGALNEPSRRALHPGRTCDNDIAALLKDHNVFGKKSREGSIVDVGSGCGSFCAGLAQKFPGVNVCGIECQEELVEQARQKFRGVEFICDRAENCLHTCRTANVVIATTQNFDYETTNHILRVAAELPLLSHLVINDSNLCRPSCRSMLKSCCCFEPLETRQIKTHWGNSFLNFTIYRRHVRWAYGSNFLPRGVKTAKALIEGNAQELLLHKSEENSQ